jgi:hypothetical protein
MRIALASSGIAVLRVPAAAPWAIIDFFVCRVGEMRNGFLNECAGFLT